ncbi:DNA-binding transcriptional regulator IlvY [compost metagenome]
MRVSLEERLSHEIVAAVAEGRADIGVVTWSEEHPDVKFWPYHEDELIIVAPAGTELGQDGMVRFVECLAHPIISLARGTAIHTFIVGKAAALGYPIDVRIQVAGFSAVIALVGSGAGIAIVPRSVMRNLQNERIKTLSLQEPWAVRHLTVCARSDEKRLSIHAQALLQQLRDPLLGPVAV